MKRIFKWLLRLAAVFALLFVGAWQFENWRGKSAWEEALKRAESAGISTDFSVPRKPDIPDEENLLKNKVFLAEWNGEIEPKLQSWDQLQLHGFKSSVPPFVVICGEGQSLDFREAFEEELGHQEAEERFDVITAGIQARTAHLAGLILSYPPHDFNDYRQFDLESALLGHSWIGHREINDLSRSFCDHAYLLIRMERSPKAIRNIKAIYRLAESSRRPGLINSMVSSSLVLASHTIIWEGLRVHAWDESQLKELEDLLYSFEPIVVMEEALRYHLLHGLHIMEHAEKYFKPHHFVTRDDDNPYGIGDEDDVGVGLKVRHAVGTGGPRGWTLRRKSIILNSHLDLMENRPAWHLLPLEDDSDQERNQPTIFNPWFIAKEQIFYSPSFVTKALQYETLKRIALIAIAAEKHFLKNGSYPATLAEVQIDFEIIDVTDPKQRPLSYQLDKNGRPEIWSVHESQNSSRPQLRWQFWEKD